MSQVLGLGSDIVECLRIAQMIERHGELFLNRVYSPREIRFCSARRHATQHFAARWAGKEALLKMLGTPWRRGIRWRDLEILNDARGQPVVTLHGGAEQVARELGVERVVLSLAHCRSHASAQALALGSAPPDRSA